MLLPTLAFGLPKEKTQAEKKETVEPPPAPVIHIGEMAEVNGRVKDPCAVGSDSTAWALIIPIYKLKEEGLDGREELCGTIYQRPDGTNVICLEPPSFQTFALKNVADKEIVVRGRFTQMVDQGRPMTESSLVFLVDSIKPTQ